jgi:UDP-2,3-diacylglucosamine hydrolase
VNTQHSEENLTITLPTNKCVYFASDFHLGISGATSSIEREKLICNWLDTIAPLAHHIFLQGDIFDAWLEYNTAVPKGFVRLLGKLAQLTDAGISITAFTGNHDLWMYGYFEQELNIKVHRKPITVSINNKTFLLGHGDGLGPGDKGYKLLKYFLNNSITKFIYKWLHPDIGIKLAQYFSQKGLHKKQVLEQYQGPDKDFIFKYCKQYAQQHAVHYFVFGHTHYIIDTPVTATSRYINLGDWLNYNSYAVFDGSTMQLKQFGK